MSASDLLVNGDESKQKSIEKRRRAVIDGGKSVRVERATASDHAELGQERPARRDEEGDRLGQWNRGGGQAPGQVLGLGAGRLLGGVPRQLVGSIEMCQQGADEGSAAVTKRIALGDGHGVADVTDVRCRRIAAAICPRQPARGGTQRRQPDRRVVTTRFEDSLDGGSVEATVATRRREGLDPTLVGPPPEGVRIHAEESARRSER